MKRNFGHPGKNDKDDVDPTVRRLFPWVLFLVFALVFAGLAVWVNETHDYSCYGHERLQAIFDNKPPCVQPTFMDRAREFFTGSTTPSYPH